MLELLYFTSIFTSSSNRVQAVVSMSRLLACRSAVAGIFPHLGRDIFLSSLMSFRLVVHRSCFAGLCLMTSVATATTFDVLVGREKKAQERKWAQAREQQHNDE